MAETGTNIGTDAGTKTGAPSDRRIRIRVLDRVAGPEADLAQLRTSLLRPLREIPSRFFYDEVGGRLFDEICKLPEYYLYRAEREILSRESRRIVRLAGAEELVELGSGASTKTRFLLDAMSREDLLKRYVPMDVNQALVRRVAGELVSLYDGLAVHGIIGDFQRGLDALPSGRRRLTAFLGGTIGNLLPAEAEDFLRRVASKLSPGDGFLLGIDLVKDPARLRAAYNDSRGVTERFNKNILKVVNRLAASDFDPSSFDHVAFYDEERRWIEMRLRTRIGRPVVLGRLAMEIHLAAGEEIRTEISRKFRRADVESLFSRTGFELADWWTDSEGLFALSLARRAGRAPGPEPLDP